MLIDRRFIAPERFMTRPEEVNDLGLEKVLRMICFKSCFFSLKMFTWSPFDLTEPFLVLQDLEDPQ